MSSLPRVLIFEDDAPLAQLWAGHLRDHYVVDIAADMAEASVLVRGNEYAVVISDLFITDDDGRADNEGGVTLISSLREGLAGYPAWCRTVPVIAVTGAGAFNGFDPLTVASNVGANRVLRKPVSLDELLDVVDWLHKKHSGDD